MACLWQAAVLLVVVGLSVQTAYDPIVLRSVAELRNHDAEPSLKLKAASTARYQPDIDNQYHLFTRANPVVSQPLVQGNFGILNQSNYNPDLWTVITIHGRDDSATSEVNAVLVPAFLAAEPCNVIVIDWSLGSTMTSDMMNAVTSAESVARFITWLLSTAGGSLSRLHIAGASLGAHSAANVCRFLNGQVAYLTGLDPAYGPWATIEQKFRPSDALYTEVIHTNAGIMGYPEPLAQVDFYPNGGVNMPGCGGVALCDHRRPYFYFAETLTGGVFTGRRCSSHIEALAGNCTGTETLTMGGVRPKTGSSGIYYTETNAAPPFAKG